MNKIGGDIIRKLLGGNLSFLMNESANENYFKKVNKKKRPPCTIILSCMDSRISIENILNVDIGKVITIKIAGNIVTGDVIQNLEFACCTTNIQAIVVMGHTDCRAIRYSIQQSSENNFNQISSKIKPAVVFSKQISKTVKVNEYQFSKVITKTHINLAVKQIRIQSKMINELECIEKIKLIGAIFYISEGRIKFLN